VSGRQWTEGPNAGRLRLRISAPDGHRPGGGHAGLHLEEINFTDAAGQRLMRVETFEPVSENPVFTLQRGALAGPVEARGRDNNGNAFDARIAP
jgi:sulfur-oxidizing protein SoxY